VLCARQSVGGPRRDRRVLGLLRPRQRAETRRKPLSARDPGDQYRQADRGLHAGVLRQPRRLGRSAARSDLHSRPAPVRLDAAGADPSFALAGGRHAGALGHPADRARTSGPT
jgi:hypothetical protein